MITTHVCCNATHILYMIVQYSLYTEYCKHKHFETGNEWGDWVTTGLE